MTQRLGNIDRSKLKKLLDGLPLDVEFDASTWQKLLEASASNLPREPIRKSQLAEALGKLATFDPQSIAIVLSEIQKLEDQMVELTEVILELRKQTSGVGPQGIPGSQGQEGIPGGTGLQGIQGISGEPGEQGLEGPEGPAGSGGGGGDGRFWHPDLSGTSGAGSKGLGEHPQFAPSGEYIDLSGALDYEYMSSRDLTTDVTALELEQLTDGSNADILHGHSGVGANVVIISGAYTAQQNDNTILCDALYSPFTVTLFSANGNGGKLLYLKKIDVSGQIVTIDPSGTETIDEDVNYLLELEDEFVQIISDDYNWHVVSE